MGINHRFENGMHKRFLSVEPLLEPIPRLPLNGVDWVIVGGESGPRCRPMDPDWVRQVRDRCIEHGVPFFFKQWGGVRKKKNGRLLDGRTWDELPQPKDRPTRKFKRQHLAEYLPAYV